MLLQASAELCRDILRLKGRHLPPRGYVPDRADPGEETMMSYEGIAILMFSSMMVMLMTGQRVFGAIGFVATAAAIVLYGTGGSDFGFSGLMKVMAWYPLLTLPMFIFMGYVLSESRIADDLYRMFHVWMGGLGGGLAIGTIGLMVLISAMNGLSVAGMAIGATIALPELLRRGYDKRMVTGVIQAGSSLGILVPPSVVLVLYAMIARQPVGQLWLAGVVPGADDGGALRRLHRDPLPAAARTRPAAAARGARRGPAGEAAAARRGTAAAGDLLRDDGALRERLDIAGGKLGHRRDDGVPRGGRQGPDDAARCSRVSVRQTLAITCMFMWIIAAALAFGAVFDGLGAVRAIEGLFTEKLGLGPWGILILMQLSFIVMGTFLDDTAMLVIVAPLYVPLVGALGFDLIWYGVLYTITTQIAYMTPPFGYNLFLMRAMAPPEIGLGDIYRSIVPFVGVMVVGPGHRHGLPRNRAVAAGLCLWKIEAKRPRQGPHNTEVKMTTRRKFHEPARAVVGAGALAAARRPWPEHDHLAHADLCRPGAGRACHQARHRPVQQDRRRPDADRALLRRPAGADLRAVPRHAARHHRRGAVRRRLHGSRRPRCTVFGGYFPFACRYSLDVPVLFNQYGLKEIWDEEYAKVGVKHISAGAWDPCHFATKEPISSLADLQGKRVFTFPTAGRFLAQFGVVPVTLPWEDIEVAVQTGELDGIAWSGITEDYTVGWADVTDYFLTNNISGAWAARSSPTWTAGTSCPRT